MLASLLLLADSRLPAGGHAHSGTLAAAVAEGLVVDVPSLAVFCQGRLHTTGAMAAVFAARAASVADRVTEWNDELADLDVGWDARTPSQASRNASRAQGQGLVRVARSAWPSMIVASAPSRPHHAVALGVVAVAAGGSAADAALLAVSASVTANCSAAVRLLGLDPFAVTRVQADLAAEMDHVAVDAMRWTSADVHRLPAPSAPNLELLAQRHQRSEVRLFAS